ncbi:hypothetical protein RYX36_033675 [Vicia faba]
MKEAIRMVLESIYDPEFPDTSHFRSGRGRYSALKWIKEEWGTSRWFFDFDIKKSFHTIDRHRLVPIFKEEIDAPKLFYSIHKVFSAGRLVGGEKGSYSAPHSVLLSALQGNIYLHKLDQEIGSIQQKYKIPRIRSILLRTGRIDDQENSVKEASLNAPQDNRAIIVAAFLNKPSSLLCAALFIEATRVGLTLKTEFYGRECCFNKNLAVRDLIKYCKIKGLLIELGEEARLVIRLERVLARKLAPFKIKTHYFIRICYMRFADDLLLGIVGVVELLIEIQKQKVSHRFRYKILSLPPGQLDIQPVIATTQLQERSYIPRAMLEHALRSQVSLLFFSLVQLGHPGLEPETSPVKVVKLDQVRGMDLFLCTVHNLLADDRSTVRAQYSGGWFRFDKGIMPGRRSSIVGSRHVRFGSRARTINRRCTILDAMYVNLDLRDSYNGTHNQRRTTSSGLDETKNINIKKLLGVSSERKSPSFIHIHSLVYKNKRETNLIVPVLELYPVLPLACPEDLLSKVDLITASSVQVFIDRVDLLGGWKGG